MLILFCSGFLMLSGHSLTVEAKLKKPVIKSVTYEDVGDFIHSSSFYNGVKITPLVDIYEDSFQMAIRVLPDSVTPINEVRTVTEVLSVYPNAKCHTEDRIAKIAKGETVTLLWTNEKHGYVCYEPGKYGFVLNPEDKLKK